ncbi:rRNA maturation RNase YbeY [Rhodospirillaceae bacterium RKSG073]|nr:rRNA maturation RNase YbeY [Curvivirga aplysinae]MTI08748.1 rRNA maturation RNase YbeY [Curvivirga aplysinae]
MSELDIDIIRNADHWPDSMDTVVLRASEYVWEHAPEGAAQDRMGELAITLSDNDQVQALNRDWRGKDKPTNVLSFAAEEGDEFELEDMPPEMVAEMPRLLGDIILAYETVLQEAETQGKLFEHHLTHLVMHGVLHLLGYDHIEENEAEEMEALETAYLAEFGISDPYIEGFEAPE